MSEALLQRRRHPRAQAAEPRSIPMGYGLVLGAAVSIGLWVGIFWLVRQALG